MGTYSDLQIINDSLNNIKTSVTNKGVTPSGNITTYATAINNLPTPMPVIPREVVSGVFQMPTSDFTYDLPSNVTDLGTSALVAAFWGCKKLVSVEFSNLTHITGEAALAMAFRDCASGLTISFPKLTSTSFGTYTNQFNSMCYRTAATVHFPSNLQSVIGNWTDVRMGFGGGATVLFDLPATT